MFGILLAWDKDLQRGDLVSVSQMGGLLLLVEMDMTSDSDHERIESAVFLETRLIDFSVDKEVCPVILHEGRPMIVSRGSVVRAG